MPTIPWRSYSTGADESTPTACCIRAMLSAEFAAAIMRMVGPDAKAGERSRRRTASHAQRSARQVPSGRDGVGPGGLHAPVSRPRRASDLAAARVSGAAAVLALALYALFVGTAAGREVDGWVVRHGMKGLPDRAAEHVTALINPP